MYICVYMPHVCKCLKMVPGALELELRAVESHLKCGLGSGFRSSERPANTLQHRAVFQLQTQLLRWSKLFKVPFLLLSLTGDQASGTHPFGDTNHTQTTAIPLNQKYHSSFLSSHSVASHCSETIWKANIWNLILF